MLATCLPRATHGFVDKRVVPVRVAEQEQAVQIPHTRTDRLAPRRVHFEHDDAHCSLEEDASETKGVPEESMSIFKKSMCFPRSSDCRRRRAVG